MGAATKNEPKSQAADFERKINPQILTFAQKLPVL
jgi:hypothetical protein